MATYLIRRTIQMLLVLWLSTIATYALLNFAPGGPLRSTCQSPNKQACPTPDVIAQRRIYYELDLDLVWRYTRWLAGFPNGPIQIGDYTFFADMVVGCQP